MNFKPKQKAWVDAAAAAGYPAGAIVGYPEIDAVCESMGGVTRPWWMINNPDYRAGRGKFRIPEEGAPNTVAAAPAVADLATPVRHTATRSADARTEGVGRGGRGTQ